VFTHLQANWLLVYEGLNYLHIFRETGYTIMKVYNIHTTVLKLLTY